MCEQRVIIGEWAVPYLIPAALFDKFIQPALGKFTVVDKKMVTGCWGTSAQLLSIFICTRLIMLYLGMQSGSDCALWYVYHPSNSQLLKNTRGTQRKLLVYPEWWYICWYVGRIVSGTAAVRGRLLFVSKVMWLCEHNQPEVEERGKPQSNWKKYVADCTSAIWNFCTKLLVFPFEAKQTIKYSGVLPSQSFRELHCFEALMLGNVAT